MAEPSEAPFAEESTLEKLWWRLGPLVVPLLLVIVALYFALDFRSNWLNAQRAAALTACQSHLKNIGGALERYAKDNSGHYPESLTSLTPDYLESLPLCPSQDLGYKLQTGPNAPGNTSKFEDYYVVWCGGEAHGDSHVFADYPRYDGVSGLRLSH